MIEYELVKASDEERKKKRRERYKSEHPYGTAGLSTDPVAAPTYRELVAKESPLVEGLSEVQFHGLHIWDQDLQAWRKRKPVGEELKGSITPTETMGDAQNLNNFIKFTKATASSENDDRELKHRLDRYMELAGQDTSDASLEQIIDSLQATRKEDITRETISDWIGRREEDLEQALGNVYTEMLPWSKSPYRFQNVYPKQTSDNDAIDEMLDKQPRKVYYTPTSVEGGELQGPFHSIPRDEPPQIDSPLLQQLHQQEEAKKKALTSEFGEDVSQRVEPFENLRNYHPDIRNSLDVFTEWFQKDNRESRDPKFRDIPLIADDDPRLTAARRAVARINRGHEPSEDKLTRSELLQQLVEEEKREWQAMKDIAREEDADAQRLAMKPRYSQGNIDTSKLYTPTPTPPRRMRVGDAIARERDMGGSFHEQAMEARAEPSLTDLLDEHEDPFKSRGNERMPSPNLGRISRIDPDLEAGRKPYQERLARLMEPEKRPVSEGLIANKLYKAFGIGG